MKELWRSIPNYEDAYEVSNQCRIRSLARTLTRRNGRRYPVKPRILRPKTHQPSGLTSVTLSWLGEQHNVYCHAVAREAFGESIARQPQ
jgi:hypothetical protein